MKAVEKILKQVMLANGDENKCGRMKMRARMYLDGQVFKDITVIAHSDRAMRYHNVYTWRESG